MELSVSEIAGAKNKVKGEAVVSKFGFVSLGALALAMAVAVGPASAEGFTGFYVGLQLGDVGGDIDQAQSTTVGGAFTVSVNDYKPNSLQGGAHIGYNHQFDKFIVGAVLDRNYVNFSTADNGPGTGGDDYNVLTMNSITTLRARGGWAAWPNTLVYATAGWAWMQDGTLTINNTVAATSTKESHGADFSGLTYGLGAEFVIGENSTMGLEWRHYSLDDERISFTLANNGYDIGVEPDLDAIELSFSYYFAGMLH